MKITAAKVTQFIATADNALPAVLIYGPDAGLVDERAHAILQKRLGEEHPEILHLTPDIHKEDPARLIDELTSASLFGGATGILVSNAGNSLTATLKPLLEEGKCYTNFLVITAGNLDTKSSLRQFFEKHKSCAALPCYADDGRTLHELIATTFREEGITCGPDVIPYLQSHLGSDRAVTRSELKKLVLYAGDEKKLSLEAVRILVGDSSGKALDDLINAACNGDAAQSDVLLRRLFQEGTVPVQILRGFARYVDILDTLLRRQKEGDSLENLFSSLRIFYKQQPVTRQHLRRWTRGHIQRARAALLITEAECKQTGATDTLLCSRTVMQLASLARKQSS